MDKESLGRLPSMSIITDLGGWRSSWNPREGQSLVPCAHSTLISPQIEHVLHCESLNWGCAEDPVCTRGHEGPEGERLYP